MRKFAAILTVLVMILPALALGHVGGFTYEVTTNGYFVDIGSNALEFTAGELSLFDYTLYATSDPNNPTDFDNTYVTIGDDERILLSTFIHRPENSLAVLSFVFPQAGEYQMTARFQRGSEVLAEASFPFQVRKGEDWFWPYVWLFLAADAGLALGWLAFRKRTATGGQPPTA